jgi:chitodextrinase
MMNPTRQSLASRPQSKPPQLKHANLSVTCTSRAQTSSMQRSSQRCPSSPPTSKLPATEIQGDLTIRGVTREVTFAVEGPTPPTRDPWGNTRIVISATTKFNRKDFGLTWNAALETGGILVGDEVTITLDVEFIKA